ncbi:hypothetical protein E3P99_00863 [Wallemia hederae]|uniref:BHLH domain-containing protein n=1 Tax=Wallemia hederae TaxID=1540922 RepID=A0A4T0FY19_9BASI|nr:hypothetical protein E3P99_00863 [Wallemia hederae]
MPASGFFMPSNPLSSSIPKIRQEGGFNSPDQSTQQPQQQQQQQQQQSSVHSHSWRDFHSTFDISDTLDSLMQTDNSANNWMQPQPQPHHQQQQLQQNQQPQSPLINFHHQNVYDQQSHSPVSDELAFDSPHLSSQPYPRRNSMVRDSSRNRAGSNASGVGKAPSSRSRASRASISGPAPHMNTPQSQNGTPVPAQAIFIPSSAPATQPWGHSFPGTVPQNSSANNESGGHRRMSVDYGATPSSLGQDNSLRDEEGKSGESITERRRRRRESHNAVERRRRDNINERIAELATLLPEELLLDSGPPNARSNKQSQTPLQGHQQLLEPLSPRHSDQLPSSFSGRLETLDETQVANLQPGQSPNSAQQQSQQSQQKQQAVAAAAAGKPNKGVILRKSVDYIRYLQQVVDAQAVAQREMQAELEYFRRSHPQSVNAAQAAFRDGTTDSTSSPKGLLLQFDKNANHREQSASAVSASAISDGSEDFSNPPPPPLQPLVKHEDIKIEDMNYVADYGLDFGQYDFNVHQNQPHNHIQAAMEQ